MEKEKKLHRSPMTFQSLKFLKRSRIYDLALNQGLVNLGISADRGGGAAASIKKCWSYYGKKLYPKKSPEILICADSAGSNGYRLDLWKYELQKWSKSTGLKIHVCHFPPDMSKWNKIEHRYISKNWRGCSLVDYVTIINLISNTKTKSGLGIKAYLDKNKYRKGRKLSKDELQSLNIKREKFHGEWNYKVFLK